MANNPPPAVRFIAGMHLLSASVSLLFSLYLCLIVAPSPSPNDADGAVIAVMGGVGIAWSIVQVWTGMAFYRGENSVAWWISLSISAFGVLGCWPLALVMVPLHWSAGVTSHFSPLDDAAEADSLTKAHASREYVVNPPGGGAMVDGRKSPGLAALLGFFFGAFGLFYISASQGLTALVVMFVVGCGSGGTMAPLVLFGFAVWGYAAAVAYNQAIDQAEAATTGAEAPGANPFEHQPVDAPTTDAADGRSSNPFV
jgi:hypothetical protein